MKRIIVIAVILGVFYWMNVATSIEKEMPFPLCFNRTEQFLWSKPELQAFVMSYFNDTLVIKTNVDSAWVQNMDTICQIYRDSCKVTNLKILIVDSSSSNWDTRYGHKLYFRQCP
ncbi:MULTISPECIES: hypothetical protein [unclassified Paraflavitalea]|uniref:hypothetical protein n=1 Tax=unclassified Paraflavitalea TaxID=2798305 RepID=UPI003D3582ED